MTDMEEICSPGDWAKKQGERPKVVEILLALARIEGWANYLELKSDETSHVSPHLRAEVDNIRRWLEEMK